MSPSNFKCLWRMGRRVGYWNGRQLVLRKCWTIPVVLCLYLFLQSSLPSFRMNFSHPARSISSSLFSLPSVTLGPTPSYVPFPAYNMGTSRCAKSVLSPSSSNEVAMGLLPLKRFRMSIIPFLHSPYPCLSCWQVVGRVSDSGGRRQSAGVFLCTITQSLFCRQRARAAPCLVDQLPYFGRR
jgi:hypothetical protein